MLTIRDIRATDKSAWAGLYAGYAAFYKVEQTAAMRETVWGWLQDRAHSSCGLVAEFNANVVGLAHFRAFARPLSASTGGFLDDLFVDPAQRGSGAAEGLLRAVADHGRAQGWSVLRWITADDNYRARGLYDRVADRTKWLTYDIKL